MRPLTPLFSPLKYEKMKRKTQILYKFIFKKSGVKGAKNVTAFFAPFTPDLGTDTLVTPVGKREL